MPSLNPADAGESFDIDLLQNGAVSLYWDRAVLNQACTLLASLGYDVVRLDAGSWHDVSGMFEEFAAAFAFPDYFGCNLAALNDCLSDVAAGGYGGDAVIERLALVLTGFDSFAGKEPHAAYALADMVADQSRSALLLGHRMLCLLHVDDSRFALPPVGAQPVVWNPAEWLDSKRGL